MSLTPNAMSRQRREERHIGAAVSSSSSLESVNSVDVEVSLGHTEANAGTRASLPNLTKVEEPIQDWQNIFQPLLTGEVAGVSGVQPFQAFLDLISNASPQLLQQCGRQGAGGGNATMSTIPPAPPLPGTIPTSRKTRKLPSPPAGRTGILHSRSLDYGTAILSSSPPTPSESLGVLSSSPPTLFQSTERYRYYLEAGTSMMTPHGEDTITYLNKGQFYGIVFEARRDASVTGRLGPKRQVRSIVSLVFREERDEQCELQHWEYWHSQQPNQLLRAFDTDRKTLHNVESIEDVSHNATAFLWDPRHSARVCIRVNCLSTEFSPQKGIRGMPLFLQIDTFDDITAPDPETSHRCYCKIKIFRDKGAERKNKDESKSADRRMAKILKQQQQTRRRGGSLTSHHRSAPFPSSSSSGALVTCTEAESEMVQASSNAGPPSWLAQAAAATQAQAAAATQAQAAAATLAQAAAATQAPPPPAPPSLAAFALPNLGPDPSGFFQVPSKVTFFTPTSTLGRRPVFFVPQEVPKELSGQVLLDMSAQSAQLSSLIQESEQRRHLPGRVDATKDELSNLDMGGPRSKNPRTERRLPAVTVYVRKEEETVYNAIMLDQLTVQELSVKAGDKYDVPAGMIKNVYKRTKRGILVNLDDRMVQQFVNEDDFVIQMVFDNQLGQCDLYLHY